MVKVSDYTFLVKITSLYLSGGAMMDVAVNATSVHPAMRTAIFQMETFDERMIQKLREEYPDSG